MVRWMAWRLHRKGLIGFALGGFLVSFFYGAAFLQAAGTTTRSQAQFGRSVNLVAKQFQFLIPIPVHPETLGGYEQYKWLSAAVIMMMIWAALAGVGAGRGDEDRGLTGQWLLSGVPRSRLLLARSTAFAMVALACCLGSVLGIAAIAPLVHQDPNLGGELLKALSMASGLLAGYAIALVISQLPAERQTATALGIGSVVLLLLLNGLADTVKSAAPLGVISPFHWIEKTSSAAPGGNFDLGATLGLAAAALALIGIAAFIFARRDLGTGLLTRRARTLPPSHLPASNPLLRRLFTEGLWEQRIGLGAWAAGTLLLAALMESVTRSMGSALAADPAIAAVVRRASPGSEYASLLGFVWFGIALLLLAGYAVVQVSRWSAQDQEGRVEMLLSAPLPRARIVIERALEFAIASFIVVLAGYAGLALEAPFAGLGLDGGRLLIASALLWPFALAFGGLGVAVASRWPQVAVPLLAAFAVAEYFLGDLAPLFKAPQWVANLSVFHLYGNPVAGSLSWTPVLWMTAVFVAGFAAALFLIERRDVAAA